ncbi:MAG TPA: glycosyltransferase family 2 protein [Candidatus Polarisedimenticolia bacterium]|nr:glycosyltransferase family 2 protein [Candidatus Polarisedimenticolia bacterium]
MPETPDSRARLSAVMLTHGQWEFTARCLQSLRDDLAAGMELVLVDNGSTDGTPERARWEVDAAARLTILENHVNLGFPAGCNLGIAKAQGEFLLFLNNDLVLPRGGIARLLSHLESPPGAGLVGPRSNRVAGEQCLPSVDYDQESLEGYEECAARLASANAGRASESARLIGFCLLVRRAVIERIGGFDPIFGIGNFEDDDFCLRARLAGFRLLRAEDVLVHHFGGRTFKAAGIDRDRAVLANWEVFKEKWGLPRDRTVQRFYAQPDFDHLAFVPEDHRLPLEPQPPPLEERRAFNFLLHPRAGDPGWEQAVRDYLGAFTADDDVALLVRLGPDDGGDRILDRLAAIVAAGRPDGGASRDPTPRLVTLDLPLRPGEEMGLYRLAGAVLGGASSLPPGPKRLAEIAGCPILESGGVGALRAAAARRED